MTIDQSALDQAVFAFYEAKAAENRAREQRLACENTIIELIGVKEEGTISQKTDQYKISTTGSLKRDFIQGFEVPCEFRISPEGPLNDGERLVLARIVKYKAELDPTAFKKLASSDPGAYRVAAQWVTAKPQKPSVKLEIIEQKQAAA